MYFSAPTLDDLLHDVLKELLQRPFDVCVSRSASLGDSSEIMGALLHLENPRARLSRTETKGTVFSALGEFLWYLSKTNSLAFITYYIPKYEQETEDEKTVYGGYGPRLFNFQNKHDQVDNIIKLLQERSTSRKAVIQLFDAEDIASYHKEIPCTCTLQFLLRKGRLNMCTFMRSNDAFVGLPHDIFAFTMLQEVIARSLGVEVGTYSHSVGSLHLYKKDEKSAQQYLNEGFQPTTSPMPPMPEGNPWLSIAQVLEAETKIRTKQEFDSKALLLDSYWLDLVRILQLYALFKDGRERYTEVNRLLGEMVSPIYFAYIRKRIEANKRKKM